MKKLIPLFLAKELSESESAGVQEHLTTCPDCRQEVNAQARTVGRLKEAFAANDLLGPWKWDASRINAESPFARLVSWFSLPRLLPLSLGLTIVLLAAVHLYGTFGRTPSASEIRLALVQSGQVQEPSKPDVVFRVAQVLPARRELISRGDTQLRHRDRTTATLAPDCRFSVDIEGFTIHAGGARFKVEPGKGGFRVVTPACILGVRGTEFACHVTQDYTAAFLWKGSLLVEDSSGFQRFLKPGEGVLVRPGTATVDLCLKEDFWDLVTATGNDPHRFLARVSDLARHGHPGDVSASGAVALTQPGEPEAPVTVASPSDSSTPVEPVGKPAGDATSSLQIPGDPLDPDPDAVATAEVTLSNPEDLVLPDD